MSFWVINFVFTILRERCFTSWQGTVWTVASAYPQSRTWAKKATKNTLHFQHINSADLKFIHHWFLCQSKQQKSNLKFNMIQTMFNWFNQLSQLAHNSCTILPSPWSDPLAPPWSRPMRWVGSEFHPIGWYDLVIQPYQFLGHEPMSDLVHLRWCQVGNFAKLESNLSWHVLQKHLTLYIWLFCTSTSTVWLFLMKLVVPEPHYDQYLGFSNWAFTKAQKTTKWQNDTKCICTTVVSTSR